MKRIFAIALCAALALGACDIIKKPLSAAEMLDLGEKYLLELDYEQAIVQFTKVIEIEPKNARAYVGAAEAYLALGSTDEAAAVLWKGLEELPGEKEIAAVQLECGEKYLAKRSYASAAGLFARLAEFAPRIARVYLGAAEAYIALGDTAKAAEVLRQGLKALPGDAEIASMLAALETPPEPPEAPPPDTTAEVTAEPTPEPSPVPTALPTTEPPPQTPEPTPEPTRVITAAPRTSIIGKWEYYESSDYGDVVFQLTFSGGTVDYVLGYADSDVIWSYSGGYSIEENNKLRLSLTGEDSWFAVDIVFNYELDGESLTLTLTDGDPLGMLFGSGAPMKFYPARNQ